MIQAILSSAWGLRSRRRLFRWLGAALSVLAAVFLVYLLWLDRATLTGLDWSRYWKLVPGVLGLYLGSMIAQGLAWGALVSSWHTLTWKDAEIFSRSAMMKGIPGTAWHWLGRTAMYSGETDLPGIAVIRATALEVVFIIISALALIPHGLPVVPPALALLCSGLALAAGLIVGFRSLPGPRRDTTLALRSLLLILLYSLAWIFGGMILEALVEAMGAPRLGWHQATTIWAVTGTTGLLVSFLPSSLGLRELLLVLLLSPSLPAARIVVLGGTLRLIFLVGDFVWGAVGWGVAWAFGHLPAGSVRG
jgi:hypothetical protein